MLFATITWTTMPFFQQSNDASHLSYPIGEDAEYLMFSPSTVNSLPVSTNNEVGCTFQNKLPEQALTLESPEAFFLNPSRIPGGQQYTSQFLQDKGSSFACNPFVMDLHQFPSVQPCQEVSVDQYLQCRDDTLRFSDKNSVNRYSQLHQEALMDQYLQYRHNLSGFLNTHGMGRAARRNSQWSQEVPMDQYMQYRHAIPWFSDGYGPSMSSSSHSQWHQLYTQMGSVVYQWDLPSFRRQIHSPPPDGWRMPLSELQPIRRPHMRTRSMEFGGSVTSTPVQIPMPLGYHFPSHGMPWTGDMGRAVCFLFCWCFILT